MEVGKYSNITKWDNKFAVFFFFCTNQILFKPTVIMAIRKNLNTVTKCNLPINAFVRVTLKSTTYEIVSNQL